MRVSDRVGVLMIGIMAAVPALAQQDDTALPPAGEVLEDLQDIDPAEWLERALGRTVYYTIGGEPFGREYYAPDGVSVVFQHVSGICLEGEWVYREEIRAYCYLWPSEVSCFRHLARGDEWLILPVEADGTPSGSSIQQVDDIVPVPLSCAPMATS